MASASESPGPPSRVGRLATWRRLVFQPPVLLVAMAITFPELLTGSTPFLTLLLNPLSLPFLVGLYGAGVLLIREARIRWKAEWPSVLLLGAAYGILEEAIATKTFFDPALVGFLGVYGHFAGVNWVWAVQLAVFHAIFSIALPIFLLDIACPATRGLSFLTPRGLRWTALAMAGTVAFMFAFFVRYYPSVPLLLLFGGIAFLLAGVAYGGARRWPGLLQARGASRPGRLTIAGALFVWGFFALNWVGPRLIAVPAAVVGLEVLLGAGTLLLALRATGPSPGGVEVVALSIGLLSFLLVLASVLEVAGDWGVGIAVAGVVVLLVLLRRQAARPGDDRHPAGSPASPPALELRRAD
jgi:hypothetical protein